MESSGCEACEALCESHTHHLDATIARTGMDSSSGLRRWCTRHFLDEQLHGVAVHHSWSEKMKRKIERQHTAST